MLITSRLTNFNLSNQYTNIMTNQKADMFMMTNGKFFPSHQLGHIREKLLKIDENNWGSIQMLQFKDPTTALILSLLVGSLGVDRFYLGHTGLGVGKLLTCGGMGIWQIVDWFLIMGACREKNLETLQRVLY